MREDGGMRNALWLSPEEVIEPTVPVSFQTTGINEKGQYAGAVDIRPSTPGARGGYSIAVLVDGTQTFHIKETKGLQHLRIWDLNNRGEVLGQYTKRNLDRAFIWDATRGMVELESPGSHYLEPEKMNNQGMVIGSAETRLLNERLVNLGVKWSWVLDLAYELGGESERDPVIWFDNELFFLESLIANFEEWEKLDFLTDINSSGWIVGVGDLNGSGRAFLLKQTPD